jgi:hypothetical protein
MNILKRVGSNLSILFRELFPNWFYDSSSKPNQKHLSIAYKVAGEDLVNQLSFDDVGFGCYSQSNEDGILIYICARLGLQSCSLIDIGSARPFGSNTTNLIVNWGWDAILIDGNKNKCRLSKHFFESHRYTKSYPPQILNQEVSVSNINRILEENNCPQDVGLLSIDIDGIDYYIWESITFVKPKVVVIEFNRILGPNKSISVPYSEDFYENQDNFYYQGAALSAFEKLAKSKGYDLVGCNRRGYNAFFVRSELNQGIFPIVSVKDCFSKPLVKSAYEKQLITLDVSEIMNLDWHEI